MQMLASLVLNCSRKHKSNLFFRSKNIWHPPISQGTKTWGFNVPLKVQCKGLIAACCTVLLLCEHVNVRVPPIPWTYPSEDSQMLSSLLKSRLGRRSWGNSSSSLSSRSPAAPGLSSTPAMTGMSGRTGWDSRLSWLVATSARVKLSARDSAWGTKAGSERLATVCAPLDMTESLLKHVAGQDGKFWFPKPVTVPLKENPPMLVVICTVVLEQMRKVCHFNELFIFWQNKQACHHGITSSIVERLHSIQMQHTTMEKRTFQSEESQKNWMRKLCHEIKTKQNI